MFVIVVLAAGLFLSSCGLASGRVPPEADSGPGPFTFTEGSTSYVSLYRRAADHIEREEYEEAESLYRDLIALEPDNASGYVGLGTALSSQGHYEEAAEAFEKALDMHPEFVEALIGMGSTRFRLEEYEAALDFYGRALVLDGENLNALWGLAITFNALGRDDEALAHLQTIVDLVPGSAFAAEAERLRGEIRQ